MPDTKLMKAEETPVVQSVSPAPTVDSSISTRRKDEEDDVALMHRAASGDMTPYALLFKRHADRIWRMAFLILHSTAAAEDVVQETFTRGLSHIQSYRGESEPRAWFS